MHRAIIAEPGLTARISGQQERPSARRGRGVTTHALAV
uniref:Uncharacterized protein n=1 Tax=Nonomuraea gerenzanensis TaxID=93944 RepID=A0A1M4E9T2_9ACTN|nr:hypothetical protein BN4615_P5131 [Nonomuraea gerenzanensis]